MTAAGLVAAAVLVATRGVAAANGVAVAVGTGVPPRVGAGWPPAPRAAETGARARLSASSNHKTDRRSDSSAKVNSLDSRVRAWLSLGDNPVWVNGDQPARVLIQLVAVRRGEASATSLFIGQTAASRMLRPCGQNRECTPAGPVRFNTEAICRPPAPICFGCERERVGSIKHARRRAKGLSGGYIWLRSFARRRALN